MKDSFETYIGLAIFSALTAALLITEISYSSTAAAALLTFVSIGLYTHADALATKEGKSKAAKLSLGLAPLLTELLLIGAAASTGYVTDWVGVYALGTIAMLEALNLNLFSIFKKVFRPAIGRNWRMVLLGITLLLSSLNPLYLFYGTSAVALAATYDFIEMLYRALYS